MPEKTNDIEIKIDESGNVTIFFQGRLDSSTVAQLWSYCLNVQKQHNPQNLILDLSLVTYCDGAGMALLLEIKQLQSKNKNNTKLVGLSIQLQKLLNIIESAGIVQESPKPSLDFITKIGISTVKALKNIQANIIFVGMFAEQLLSIIFKPKSIRWRDFWRAVEDVGPNALFLVILIGFLVGLISAFQGSAPLARFGAQIYLPNLVGLGMVREMGPLMTAVLLAGRTASSFAAELGTMKVNQEVDALITMGLNPIKFLAIPRLLAVILMSPLLNIFLIFFSLIGCGLVMKSLGYSIYLYVHQLRGAITLGDFVSGMVKTFAFGMVIAGVGCLHGLKTKYGPSAVGYSTTQAVVSSIGMIVFIDGIFASIYYVFGI